jgi:hypothetical protein
MYNEKDINEQIAWAKINEDVLRSMENPRKAYWLAVLICILMLACAAFAEYIQYTTGMGPANLNNPHMWDMYIATFVFWIVIGNSSHYSCRLAKTHLPIRRGYDNVLAHDSGFVSDYSPGSCLEHVLGITLCK